MKKEKILLGAGCFWGVEKYFKKVPGVIGVNVGYSGGQKSEPSYEEVCTGGTGHAEVAEVEFDREIISLDIILEHFWQIHDPTQLNQQGPDVGTQYRSAIFYFDEEQRKTAENSKLLAQEKISKPIVTEIDSAKEYWKAEDYHQNYLDKKGV